MSGEDDLKAGDIGVLATYLSELPPDSLMNATVGLHMAILSLRSIEYYYPMVLSSLSAAKYGSYSCGQFTLC